jgi:dUTP pyrophosphatase
MEITVKIKYIPHEGCASPETPLYATGGSAACDLRACIPEPLEIKPGMLASVPTGVAVSLPSHEYAAFVFARSGLAVRHGIALSNGVGVIDSDYRGEIRVGLVNLSEESYTIAPGERIAQMAFLPVCRALFEICESLDETARGAGGFGSTGK